MKNIPTFKNSQIESQCSQLQSQSDNLQCFRISTNSIQNQGVKKFQRSGLQNFNVNTKNHNTLKCIQKIASLKIEIVISNICEILQNKTYRNISYAYDLVRKYQKNYDSSHKMTFSSISQQAAPISPNDRDYFIQVASLFHHKIQNVVKNRQIKQLGSAFGHILICDNNYLGKVQRTKSIEKSQSIVKPYKGNYSEKNDSEWSLGISQGFDHSDAAIKQNKMLKRKKNKIIKGRENFINKMDQLLAVYQNNLDKHS